MSKPNQPVDKSSEIRIGRVSKEIHDDLKTIAQEKGITLNSFMKGELRAIRDNNQHLLDKTVKD